MPKDKTVIIIPTYNEKDNVALLTDDLLKQHIDFQILFIDDNSPDGTGEVLEALREANKNIAVLHRRKKTGLASAYREGISWALSHGYEIVIIMDGDLSHVPAELPLFLEKIESCDVVFGSRYLANSKLRNWPLRRRFFSRAANYFVCLALGLRLTDITTSFKCFRREVLEAVALDDCEGRDNAFFIELADKISRSGFKIAEIPITFCQRKWGVSKLRLASIVDSAWITLKILCRKRNYSDANRS